MNTLLRFLVALLLVAVLVLGYVAIRSISHEPLVDAFDPGALAKATGGRTAEIDAGREPARRDTASVSGVGGDTPAVRIEYRDRWHTPPAPSCPDGSPAETDASTRVAIVPIDAPPLAALPRRPISVSPDRVILTYQRAEGDSAGQTVQDVFVVPERRWGAWLAAVGDVATMIGDSLAWEPSLGLTAHVRYRRLTLSTGISSALDELAPRIEVGMTWRLWGR